MMTSARSTLVTVAAILAITVAACGSDADGGDTTVPTASSTTAAATTTTAAAETTTTVALTTSTAATTTTTAAATTTTSAAAYEPDGSGCTPGAETLPDGKWYGLVVNADDSELEFDLACWFSGDDAEAAAAEDGSEAPNGFYVRNDNPATRVLEPTVDTTVVWYPDAGDPASETTATYAEWLTGIDERGVTLGIWVVIEDGLITEVTEQWVP